MWQREVFFYFIRSITIFLSFIIHFKKGQRANKCSKTTCRNENKKLSWEMDCCCTFDSILKGSARQGNAWTSTSSLVSFFFALKFFDFLSLKWIFSLNLATMVMLCSSYVFLNVCSYHVTYAFRSESTLYSCLNVKELLARNRREIWSLSDCNGTRTHNH